MKIGESLDYDEQGDTLYVGLLDVSVAKTEPLDDHRLVDYGADGSVIGVEFIDVSGGIDADLHQLGPSGLEITKLIGQARGRLEIFV